MSPEGAPRFYYDLFENRLITGQDAYEDVLATGTHPQDLVDLRTLLLERDRYVDTLPNDTPRPTNKKSPYTYEQVVETTSWLGHEVFQKDDRVIKEHFLLLYRLGLGASGRRIKSLGGYGEMYQAAELPNAIRRGAFDHWDIDDITIYTCNHAREALFGTGPTLVKALRVAHKKGQGPSYDMIRSQIPGGIPRLLNRGGIYYFRGVPDEYIVEWGVDFMFSNNGRRIDSPALELLSPKRLSPSKTPLLRRFETIDNFNILVEDRYYTELDRLTSRNAQRFNAIMQDIYYGILPASLFVDCTNELGLRQAAGKYELMRELSPTIKVDEREELARHGSKGDMVDAIMRHREDLRALDIMRFAEKSDIFEDIWPNNRAKPALKI